MSRKYTSIIVYCIIWGRGNRIGDEEKKVKNREKQKMEELSTSIMENGVYFYMVSLNVWQALKIDRI